MLVTSSNQVDVQVLGDVDESTKSILTDDALRFVGLLCAKFESTRQLLLQRRKAKAKEIDAGIFPTFLESDASKDTSWKCAAPPADLLDRRVEITGPVDRKMVINGLNSGAQTYMADFEDSTSPTWHNMMDGQVNLRDAVAGTITYTNPKNGKLYKPNDATAVLLVRPRGWHLDEAHIVVNGISASGSIVDFALYFFHNAHALARKGSGPYFYLPKLESHLEARLWNDVFCTAQDYLGVPRGTIRATVLLETITAAFEMEEILYELRDHSIGLNCGRWDYLFSFIKKFKSHHIAPDRSHLTMTTPLMKAYVQRLIQICHRRGTFAMGGMSASIPVKGNPVKNGISMKKVEQDKLREVLAGHDGTWVAHPALVKVARDIFDKHMPTPNQIHRSGAATSYVSEAQLIELPKVPASTAITSQGLEAGIAIVLAYTEAWLRGVGCIAWNNAMEDAATAEISRAQIWQWRTHHVTTAEDGREITAERIASIIRERQRQQHGKGKWNLAGMLVEEMLNANELDDFLTTVCYPYIVTPASGNAK
eukprot:CAMPEP_0119554602 /NCGR_PEP_ID=MMETSP1352-20130426/7045_1 /TAXON_ID=265584 /ORGANISM="Stauroneis constricta, Strain CCMP1120" /LENGTH=536 /DNA_ID=CAMNT_0007601217 /DNA_START=142 /DNA_END=1749 /DNA_ORIENTATION=+